MGGLAIPLLFLIVFTITGSRFSAVAAALSFMVSHTFWLLSVINESYTLNLFILSLLFLFLAVWLKYGKPVFLYAFAFVFSLSFFAGYAVLIFAPAAGYIFLKEKKLFKSAGIKNTVFYFLLGLLPWLYCLASDFAKSPSPGEFAIWLKQYAMYNQFARALEPRQFLTEIFKYPFYLFYQFPMAGFLLGIFAMIKARKNTIAFSGLILFLSVIVYASLFYYQRHFYIYVYSYLAFAVFIGLGAGMIARGKNWRYRAAVISLLVAFPVFSYVFAGRFFSGNNIFFAARDIPYRDTVRYFLCPSKRGYHGTYEYARDAFGRTKKGDTIIADYSILTVLTYFKEVEKIGGAGVKLVLDEVINIPEYVAEKISGPGGVYLADNEDFYEIGKLEKEYDIIPAGVLYKLRKKSIEVGLR